MKRENARTQERKNARKERTTAGPGRGSMHLDKVGQGEEEGRVPGSSSSSSISKDEKKSQADEKKSDNLF